MMTQTYFGLENDENAWLLVQRSGGKTIFLRRFINTLEGLNELAKCINNHCSKPRIYIKSNGCSAFILLGHLCGIPNAEVMFVSPAGFKQYQTCLPKQRVGQLGTFCCEAELLADCAERMI